MTTVEKVHAAAANRPLKVPASTCAGLSGLAGGAFQLWANLSAAQKMTNPRYQGITALS